MGNLLFRTDRGVLGSKRINIWNRVKALRKSHPSNVIVVVKKPLMSIVMARVIFAMLVLTSICKLSRICIDVK